MKKAFSFFFASVYLFLATGILFSVHYCKGKAVSIDISVSKTSSGCGDTGSCDHPCCDDKTFLLKIEKEHISSGNAAMISPSELLCQESFSSLFTSRITESAETVFFADSPPPPDEKVFIRFCSLITYG